MCRLEIGVIEGFITQCGVRPVATVYGSGMWQGKQFFAYAAHQVAHAAAGKIRAPYRAGKKNITAEDQLVLRQLVSHTIGRVPGYMVYLPAQAAPAAFDISGAECIIYAERLYIKPATPAVAGQLLQGKGGAVGFAGVYAAPVTLCQSGGILHMVKVLVSNEQVCYLGVGRQFFCYPLGKSQRCIYGYIALCATHQISVACARPAGIYLNLYTHTRAIVHYLPFGGKPNKGVTEIMGSVSYLLVFISDLARFNEVKSLNVMLRIPSVIKNAFL